jgi:7,8-dihydropterin-6-yl-methyl-4-(beta-D-ribofuranosyl)aminobenzene 5'-phosphate synthase
MAHAENSALISRRTFIRGTAAGLLTLAMPRVLGASRITVPSVDRLVVHVVVDNATFGPFLPDLKKPGLRVVRAREPGRGVVSRKTLLGEFGLSLLAESWQGSQIRRVLVDFGHTPEALANNLSLLDIDPSSINAAVLSHGHLDHYGGYPALFGATATSNQGIPLFVGGEEVFCERVALVGPSPLVMGTLDRDDLARAGLNAVIVADPTVVADHAFTTGLIELDSIERAAIPTHMRPGSGCDPAGLSSGKRAEDQIPDDGEHELATCYAVKDLGLVVISSCSHRGLINTIRQAQAVSGIDRILAVIGGFHLVSPRTDDEAHWTVRELAQIDPTYVVPMHCTGDVFMAEAARLMPDKIIKPYVGTRLDFGAGS